MEALAMNITDLDIDPSFNTFDKKCGVISCIHCIGERCTNDTCEIYERSFLQEG